ncbi:hypothetical protein Tco_0813950, partial [Tanacetum coccineum]
MAHRLTMEIVRDGEITKKGDSGKKRKDDMRKNQGCGQHNKRQNMALVNALSAPSVGGQVTLLEPASVVMEIRETREGGHRATSAKSSSIFE